MALPEDAIAPIVDCMGGAAFPGLLPPITGPGGLPNFVFAGVTTMLVGALIPLDFLPPDPENLPSLPLDPLLFITPFLGTLSIPGDLGEIDLSLVIPGAPIIPATGPNIVAPQDGLIKMILMTSMSPLLIITGVLQSIIDLSPALPTLSLIITILTAVALSIGLGGPSVTAFITCLAIGFLDIITTVIPI